MLSEIVSGWINTIFPEEQVEILAVKRITVCLTPDGLEPHCRYYNPNSMIGPKCDSCGCPLRMKVRSKLTSCPEKKWNE